MGAVGARPVPRTQPHRDRGTSPTQGAPTLQWPHVLGTKMGQTTREGRAAGRRPRNPRPGGRAAGPAATAPCVGRRQTWPVGRGTLGDLNLQEVTDRCLQMV